jgi:hypothetical protein
MRQVQLLITPEPDGPGEALALVDGTVAGRAADPVVTVTDLAVGPLRAATLEVTRARRDGPHVPNLSGPTGSCSWAAAGTSTSTCAGPASPRGPAGTPDRAPPW